jgi:uncharacterized protein
MACFYKSAWVAVLVFYACSAAFAQPGQIGTQSSIFLKEQRAAQQGDAQAQQRLGLMYRTGDGVGKDYQEAMRWFHLAAKQGNSAAMFNLGAAYYNGDGVPEDLDLSYAWFLLALEAGSAPAKEAVERAAKETHSTTKALLEIGEMYEKGEFLPKDPQRAAHWYEQAAQQSDDAKLVLAQMLIEGRGVDHDYAKAMSLCKDAAQRVSDGKYCVGLMYKKGLGVPPEPDKAISWYKEAAIFGRPFPVINRNASVALARMYESGDGVASDLTEACYWYAVAAQTGDAEARAQMEGLLPKLSQADQRRLAGELRKIHLDPAKTLVGPHP